MRDYFNSEDISAEIRDLTFDAKDDTIMFSHPENLAEIYSPEYCSGYKDASLFMLRKIRRLGVKLNKEKVRKGTIIKKLPLIQIMMNDIKLAMIPYPETDEEYGRNDCLDSYFSFFKYLMENFKDDTE